MDAPIKCHCGIDATKSIVAKDGPNRGRFFYRCSKYPRPGNCAFFQFIAEERKNLEPSLEARVAALEEITRNIGSICVGLKSASIDIPKK